MSVQQNISEDAVEIIKNGSDVVSAIKANNRLYPVSLELAVWEGGLTTTDRIKLSAQYRIPRGYITKALTRLRKLGLFEDGVGGLGRKNKPSSTIQPKSGEKVEGDKEKRLKTVEKGDSVDSENLVAPTTQPSEKLEKSTIKVGKDVVGVPKTGEEKTLVDVKSQPSSTTEKVEQPLNVDVDDSQEEEGENENFPVQPQNSGGKSVPSLTEKSRTPPSIQTQTQPSVEEVAEQVFKLLNIQPQTPQTPPVQQSKTTAETLATFLENLPTPQLKQIWDNRLKKEGNMVSEDETQLIAFQRIEQDMSWVDIMDELKIPVETMVTIMEHYNNMLNLRRQKESLEEPYLKPWFDMAKEIGKVIARNCRYYNEVEGVCAFWAWEDLPKSYRDTFRGLFRSSKKKNETGMYVNVERHSEICALCQQGKSVSEIA